MDGRIKLRHLRCFLETARLGSVTAAAEALRISQPAASKTVRELEEILGKDLFDRSGRRLSLSPAGRLFQQHAGSAMRGLNRAADLVRDTPPQTARLSVGVLPTAATRLMPHAAIAFRATFPNCLLRVTTGPNWLLMSQLREGQLDLVVGRMGSPEVMASLSFIQLYSETLVAVVRPDHPLNADLSTVSDIARYPLVLPPPGAIIAPMVRAFLSRHAIPLHQAAFETVSLAFGRRVVQQSDAVWFISRGVVQDELHGKALAALPVDFGTQGGPVGISARSGDPVSAEQEGLIGALRAASQEAAGQSLTSL